MTVYLSVECLPEEAAKGLSLDISSHIVEPTPASWTICCPLPTCHSDCAHPAAVTSLHQGVSVVVMVMIIQAKPSHL